MNFVELLNYVDALLWNKCLIVILALLGIILTIRLKGMQFRYFAYSMKLAFTRSDDKAEGDISQFQALMTALAATIGIGSIAGVATAICAGGFGAIFWMWVIASIGMATKFAEAILAVKYREIDSSGQVRGGPMYYIAKGLGWKKVAGSFAIFGILSAFAGGNLTQSNSVAIALNQWLNLPPLGTGIVMGIVTAIVLFGGIKSIGKVCAYFVPIMAIFYIVGGLFIIATFYYKIPAAFLLIVKSAFNGQAATGGFLGAGVAAAIQMGVARGVSSNEAGLGSAPIAAAAAKTDVPGRQAMISMTGVFLSSFVVCTITALVIAVTGVLGEIGADGKVLNGAALVMKAFDKVIPYGEAVVAIGIVLFGYSTIIGWAYYGEKCIEYLAGAKSIIVFRALFSCVAFYGALLSMDIVWPLVDIMNGLMALPNLIGLFGLLGVITAESRSFFKLLEREKMLQRVDS